MRPAKLIVRNMRDRKPERLRGLESDDQFERGGCSTGRSAGFAPSRILSTKTAAPPKVIGAASTPTWRPQRLICMQMMASAPEAQDAIAMFGDKTRLVCRFAVTPWTESNELSGHHFSTGSDLRWISGHGPDHRSLRKTPGAARPGGAQGHST